MQNDKKTSKYISVSQAGLELGVSPSTIRRLVTNQLLKSYRTDAGTRRIDKESIRQYLRVNTTIQDGDPRPEIKNFRYARVSSRGQLDDLRRQIEFLDRPEYSSYHCISDVASGLNFKRKGLCTILESALQGTIGEVVVAHKDRLCRFGYELIEFIISKGGGKVTVVGTECTKSEQEELTDDLLAILHVFSCKQMGRRKYKAKNRNQINQNETEDNGGAEEDS